MERKTGYYWINLLGEWAVFYYACSFKQWYGPNSGPWKDTDFEEIDEKQITR